MWTWSRREVEVEREKQGDCEMDHLADAGISKMQNVKAPANRPVSFIYFLLLLASLAES